MRIIVLGVEAIGSKTLDSLIGQCSPMYTINTSVSHFLTCISAQGDFEMMEPLFDMYLNAVPLIEERSEVWFGHPGGFFPETLFFWGTYESGGVPP